MRSLFCAVLLSAVASAAHADEPGDGSEWAATEAAKPRHSCAGGAAVTANGLSHFIDKLTTGSISKPEETP